MTPAVAEAIEEIRVTFEVATVTVKDDGEGGTYVRIDPVDPVPRTRSARPGSASGSPRSTPMPTFIRSSCATI